MEAVSIASAHLHQGKRHSEAFERLMRTSHKAADDDALRIQRGAAIVFGTAVNLGRRYVRPIDL